jgi:hypothetical protein
MSDTVRTAVVALCLVVAAVDAMVVVGVRIGAGHKVHSGIAAAAAVTGVEHSPGVVVEAEIEVEAYSAVVLRRRSWNNSMASTHLPGLAFVLDECRELARAGKIGVGAGVNRPANRKRGYRALVAGIDSTGFHMPFEDEAWVGLEAHKLGSLLVLVQSEAVMFVDLMGYEIGVAES